MKQQKIYILFLIFFWILSITHAQVSESPLTIELKGTHLSLNEPFVVIIRIKDIDPIPTVVFPEIKDFQKREVSKTTSVQKENGKSNLVHVFTQNYYPTQKGIFFTGNIEVQINKQVLRAEGISITVVNVEDENNVQLTPELESEAKKGVFLAITTNKKKVFIQEGFNLNLSLLVSEDNTAELEFYNIEQQLEQILKKIKPKNCWEENFDIREIPKNQMTINGKAFLEYRIYQATFFPFNAETITIPAVSLTMKQWVEDTKGNKTISYPVFSSKPFMVRAANLPSHLLSNQVLVGNFRLSEKISNTIMQTGNSYKYEFKIIGEGNINSIQEPNLNKGAIFDIYPSTISQQVEKKHNEIFGEKKFQYQLVPTKSGEYKLGDMIYWVFFNSEKQQYDTLRSSLNVIVNGHDIETGLSNMVEPTSIFAGLENWDTTKYVTDYQLLIRYVANFLIILMLLMMVYIIIKK